MSTISVLAGGNLQGAIDTAPPGSIVSVEAGAKFRGPIFLPKPNANVKINSSRISEIPQGQVSPSHAGLMPDIIAPHADQAIRTKPGASFYELGAIGTVPDTAATTMYDLVRLGESRQEQKTLESVPHNLSFDRCYIRGLPTTNFQRGISLNAADSSITRCCISEIHGKGMDSQAIASWNTPGRLKIEDCYLEAAGENFMSGGVDPALESMIPADIEIRRCHLFKPLSWKGVWTVKNLLEIKNGKNILIDGCVLENCWTDGQTGIAVLFTVRNQEGTAPYSVILNLTFTNNTVRNANGALNFLGSDNLQLSQRCSGALIRNNLFTDIAGHFLTINGYNDVTLSRNTHLQGGNTMLLYGDPSERFRYEGNVTTEKPYGIFGNGGPVGIPALEKYTPGYSVINNVIASPYNWNYPEGNEYPETLAIGPDYRTSYVGKGCDIDALLAAQSSSVPVPAPTPTPVPTPTPTPTPAPAPITRVVAWPTTKAAMNKVIDTQLAEGYHLVDIETLKKYVFEKFK